MSIVKLTYDPIVKRLRWVMVGAMLFSLFNTLRGQPARFWVDPEKAIRGDGLGVHNHLNHAFEFFLSHGWQPYVVSCLTYFSLAFFVVSVLPRRAALIVLFSCIFGHCFGACNWLVVRWHLGFAAVTFYSSLLGLAVAWALSPVSGDSGDSITRRLRWVMIGVILLDPLLTLLAQPGAYWHHPEMLHEGNAMSRWFMLRGWAAYVGMDLVYCVGAFLMASFLPRFFAIVSIFGFIFGHFVGVSNWFFYQWRLGMETPVIYGVVLSVVIVFVSFCRGGKSKRSPDPAERTAVGACAWC